MSELVHGSYSTYTNKGCRCDECREAAREANRKRQAKLRGDQGYVPRKRGRKIENEHGYSGYINRGCRCDICKQGTKDYRESRKDTLSEDDPRHGTQNGYVNLGCRCDLCRQAVVDYNRDNGGARRSSLKANYGITPEQWQELFDSQGGTCASCGTVPPEDAKRRFHVDHDHDSGQVRGILCHGCNVALGLLKEDVTRIEKLAVYISQWKPF